MSKIKKLISEEKIQCVVKNLGKEITNDYKGKEITVVIMLGGAFMFAADLVRQIKLPMVIKRVSAESMDGTNSTGKVKVHITDKEHYKGKDVLIIEDIVDTGLTLFNTQRRLKELGAKSVKICSLLSKPSMLKYMVNIDYLGFKVEGFVVGYGLDLDDKYRELPYVGLYVN